MKPEKHTVPKKNQVTEKWFPLGYNQFLYWLFQHFSPNNAVSRINIEGELDLSLLRKTIDKLVEKHKVLRTSYGYFIPKQIIHEPKSIPITIIDLRNTNTKDTEEIINDKYYDFLVYRPKFHSPITLRVLLFQISTNKNQLVLSIPHIAFDTISRRKILLDLTNTYKKLNSNTNFTNENEGLPYYVLCQQENNKTNLTLKDDVDFWNNFIKKDNIPLFPVNLLGNDNLKNNLTSYFLPLETPDIIKFCTDKEKISLSTYLISLTLFVISYLIKQKNLSIFNFVSTRNKHDSSDIVGCMLNNEFIQYSLDLKISWKEYLHDINKTKSLLKKHNFCPTIVKFNTCLSLFAKFRIPVKILNFFMYKIFRILSRNFNYHPCAIDVLLNIMTSMISIKISSKFNFLYSIFSSKKSLDNQRKWILLNLNIWPSWIKKEKIITSEDIKFELTKRLSTLQCQLDENNLVIYFDRDIENTPRISFNGPLNNKVREDFTTLFLKVLALVNKNPNIILEQINDHLDEK